MRHNCLGRGGGKEEGSEGDLENKMYVLRKGRNQQGGMIVGSRARENVIKRGLFKENGIVVNLLQLGQEKSIHPHDRSFSESFVQTQENTYNLQLLSSA